MTIPSPSGARVWLATGRTDMRTGFDGLALLVQETLNRDPHGGHLFVFRGRRGNLIKVLWHDARPLHLALAGGRDGGNHAGATRVSAGRDRLAAAAADLAAGGGGLSAAL